MAENCNGNSSAERPLIDQFNLTQYIKNESISSLQYLACTKIAVILWKNRRLYKRSSSYMNSNELRDYSFIADMWLSEVGTKILDIVPSLFLTKYCENDLKEMIHKIRRRLETFIQYFHLYKLPFSVVKGNIYIDSIIWTTTGRVDYLTTFSILIERTDLSTFEKYALACHCCLKEKIIDLLKMIPDNFVDGFVEDENLRLVLFWTLHLKGKDEEFYKILNRQEGYEGNVNKYILKWAIEYGNKIAVQYIWENIVDQQLNATLCQCIEVALFWEFADILCYLISQIKPQQMEELCVEKGYEILARLADKYKWRDYFKVVAKCVLEFVHKMSFSNALRTILICWKENLLERDKCENLLGEFVVTYKCDIDVNAILNSKLKSLVLLYLED